MSLLKLLRCGSSLRSHFRLQSCRTTIVPSLKLQVGKISLTHTQRTLSTEPQRDIPEQKRVVVVDEWTEYNANARKGVRIYKNATANFDVKQFSKNLLRHKTDFRHIELFPELCECVQTFTNSNIAMSIPAPSWILDLGELGFQFSDPVQRQTVLELYDLITPNTALTHDEVVAMAKGLSLMNLRWTDKDTVVSKKLKADILSHICSVINTADKLHLESLLHSMGRMRVPWHNLPSYNQDMIFTNLQFMSPYFTIQNNVSIIHALGLMGLPLSTAESANQSFVFTKALIVLNHVRSAPLFVEAEEEMQRSGEQVNTSCLLDSVLFSSVCSNISINFVVITIEKRRIMICRLL